MADASGPTSGPDVWARLRGRWQLPAGLTGTLARLRLLPSVSAPLTAALAAVVLAASLLPIAVTVVSGLLVGSIPAAVLGALAAYAGRHTLRLLGAVALMLVPGRLIGPFQLPNRGAGDEEGAILSMAWRPRRHFGDPRGGSGAYRTHIPAKRRASHHLG